ncbi:GPI inositol-deacylase [Fusarium oxysporum f. sp. cubense race 1]|uniref:GPI inositol-deacylase n=1 Tax=Fusarium oxysporum f. sp. cubense (strain race 1) TaxID=1229664 RepID=N4U2U5_FUSC1|nr:GPI inositol-deacylase [Fusarium oxysporum f. sp. cubense race 1]
MKRRSSGSADDGDESSLDSDIPDPDPNSKTRTSPARARRPSSLNWKPSNDRNGRNGQPREEPRQTTALKPTSLAAPSTPDMALARTPTQSPSPNRRIPRPRFSIVVLLTSALGIVILISILRSLVTSQLDPKGCRMSYMRPSYVRFTEFDTEHTRFATKYSLYLYREQGIEPPDKLLGIPVLFIPGNAGSYKQFRKVITKTLYDIVNVHRGSQTKPRADRMKTFKKRFLTGMEPTMEKDLPLKEATTLLTLSDDSNSILPAGQRLVLSQIGQQPKPRAHLLPIPPQGSPEVKRFTVLTDASLDEAGENGKVEVLFCSVFPFQSGQATSLYPFQIDLSTDDSGSTRLACKNAASDRILLPASTSSSRYPFYLDREREIVPFSYLQYDLDQLPDHQFVAIIEKSVSSTRSFLIAEFSDQSVFSKKEDASLAKLLLSGITVDLPANRPLTTEVNIASLQSALLAYKLEITSPHCQAEKVLFSPLVRQYLDQPYESKYFVNAQSVDVSLHGVAPYLPPSLGSGAEKGVTFQVWTDPSCGSSIHLQIKPDFWGSLGKLYMRYRTVFAAFPMLTVALVLRKQFRVYDSSGVFISFSQSLDLCLRQSIPLLLVSLTLLSMSMEGVPATWLGRWWYQAPAAPLSIDFHRHDILIGTDDPFFWFLVPLIGVVCIGVCAMVHYMTKAFTHVLGFLYWALTLLPLSSGAEDDGVARTPAFVPSTPKRRMITTAILLFLVWTFIPYQFAYLVACLVQLFTVIRALRINETAPSDANSNYYHYAHSVLLLMLWILPINLPILAVWIRNLAVHWLTPFSSHHNVLSIMPFILLVENLTTGKMVPQVGRLFGYVTSLLLFATALYAAMYGISHAYMLHYLVNIIAAWLVVLHSTKDPFSLSGLGAIFESSPTEEHKKSKASL